jgi:hypothetical protein
LSSSASKLVISLQVLLKVLSSLSSRDTLSILSLNVVSFSFSAVSVGVWRDIFIRLKETKDFIFLQKDTKDFIFLQKDTKDFILRELAKILILNFLLLQLSIQ